MDASHPNISLLYSRILCTGCFLYPLLLVWLVTSLVDPLPLPSPSPPHPLLSPSSLPLPLPFTVRLNDPVHWLSPLLLVWLVTGLIDHLWLLYDTLTSVGVRESVCVMWGCACVKSAMWWWARCNVCEGSVCESVHVSWCKQRCMCEEVCSVWGVIVWWCEESTCEGTYTNWHRCTCTTVCVCVMIALHGSIGRSVLSSNKTQHHSRGMTPTHLSLVCPEACLSLSLRSLLSSTWLSSPASSLSGDPTSAAGTNLVGIGEREVLQTDPSTVYSVVHSITCTSTVYSVVHCITSTVYSVVHCITSTVGSQKYAHGRWT